MQPTIHAGSYAALALSCLRKGPTSHDALGVTDRLPTAARGFFGRPFRVIALHDFAGALLARITDPAVRRVAERLPSWSVDRLSDSTDLVSHAAWQAALRRFYEWAAAPPGWGRGGAPA